MGRGKRRHTAKTGDKKLYQSRGRADEHDNNNKDDNSDDDPMYDHVDRFHNQKDQDFLKLDVGGDDDSSSEDDGLEPQHEAVMDLALGGGASDDEDEDDDASSASDDEKNAAAAKKHKGDDDDEYDDDDDTEENSVSSSDNDDEDEELEEHVLDWGRRKSAYYHGDTADLEIGQDEEDAVLEEQAAKEVQKARYEEMSEDDFVLSDTEEVTTGSGAKEDIGRPGALAVASRNVSKLSLKEKQKLLDRQHPELLPLLSHFSSMAEDLCRSTSVAAQAVFDGEEGTAESIGATKLGQQYLKAKVLLQSSATLNLIMYMLLKAEQMSASDDSGTVDSTIIQSHPVMLHLQKINSLAQALEDAVETKVPSLKNQLDHLVKAAALLNQSGDVSESESEVEDTHDKSSKLDTTTKEASSKPNGELSPVDNITSSDSDSDSDDGDSSSDDEVTRSRKVLTEARFGLRASEVAAAPTQQAARRKAARLPILSDAGDDDEIVENGKAVSQSLATTLNSIEQRTASRKRRATALADGLDEPQDEDETLRRGLEMMEEELGKGSDEDEMGSADPECDSDDDEDTGEDFYAQVSNKSKSKKEFKKNLYRVAPKFPRVEAEVEGERAISKQILNNRGLVAHKPKINRNPRVKKREQFRKAIIRRKGAVREVRTDEGHRYGGEETGIKTNLSRSRKLAR